MVDILTRGKASPEDKLLHAKCPKCRSWLRWRQSEGGVASDPKTQAKMSVVKCPIEGCGATVKADL